MKIVLMRHGQPDVDRRARLNAAQFGDWVKAYDVAGIDTASRPSQAAIDLAAECAITVCSNLARSQESARLLGARRIVAADRLFREMEMPHAAWRFPRIGLSLWLVFFRLAWLMGYAGDIESFKAARRRAHTCAERLAAMAASDGGVLFVGHGSLNWFIARRLKKMGWQSSDASPRRYWEFAVFHR